MVVDHAEYTGVFKYGFIGDTDTQNAAASVEDQLHRQTRV